MNQSRADQGKSYGLQRWNLRVQIGVFIATFSAFILSTGSPRPYWHRPLSEPHLHIRAVIQVRGFNEAHAGGVRRHDHGVRVRAIGGKAHGSWLPPM